MSDTNETRSRYDETRRSFDDLGVEEQTRFIVEATASTLARGLMEAGEALADGLEDVVRNTRRRARSEESADGPGPAEPETAQRQAPGTRST